MKKESEIFGKKGVASFQIISLVASLFAFSFIIYSADAVGAKSVSDFQTPVQGGGFTGMAIATIIGNFIAIPLVSAENSVLALSKILAESKSKNPVDLSGDSLPPPPSNTNVPGGEIVTGVTEVTGVTANIITQVTTKELILETAGGDILVAKGTAVTSLADGGGTVFVNKIHYKLSSAQMEGFVGKPVSKGGLSSLFKADMYGGWDAFLSGLQWAATAYMAGQMLGSMLGMSDKNTEALSTAMAMGFGSYKALKVYEFAGDSFKWLGANPALVMGMGIGVVVFISMYKTESTKTVEFNCMPWQAPTGGDDCEKCNNPNLPCSEYRCKALGQNCELVNKGTNQERCVTVRHDDTNPPVISPDESKLTYGHKYTNVKNSPPGPGFNIVYLDSDDGCLRAFTPLEFGINSDEPAQCKIDFNHTLRFDDMVSFMGGNNLYLYNHSERFSLPGAKDIENSSFPLENGKDLTFFIRCRDKQGNENSAEYAVRFCIDPTPDSTAPQIKATSITNGGCVAEEQSNTIVEFYTNEPADCRWSPQNQDYNNMQNGMVCSSKLYQINAAQLFTCKANLTGIARDETKFYVRCKDQPGKAEEDRNENKESYMFSLRGSTGLKIKNLQPNGTIFGAVRPSPVELYVESLFGCNNGRAVCFYSTTDKDNDYIMFYDTNTEDGIHTQRLDLDARNHKYYIKCVDEGGNVVKDVMEFSLDIDESAPVVARVYEEDQMLKIVTVRDSECVYSLNNCDFSFDEGTQMPYANSTVHVAEWIEGKTYYIKCRDEFKNEDADCSVVVRLSQDFL